MKFRERFRRVYPFTFPGTVLLAVALYLLGTAWYSGNIYALTFSLLALPALFLLAFFARLQAFRLRGLSLMWDCSRPIFSRVVNQRLVFFIGKQRAFYFFRLHIRMHGHLLAGRDAPIYFRTEAAASSGGEIVLPVNFPVCGRLDAKITVLLRDVFGFVEVPTGVFEERTISVRPPLFSNRAPERYLSMISEESIQRRRSSEEEKYYMRQYAPGDRMKDINWKASVRVFELITRVSPLSEEQSHQIEIDFRHFSREEVDGPIAIIHLNFIKSWLLSFLQGIKSARPSYQFRIVTGQSTVLLQSEEDIDQFAGTLATLTYMPERRAFHDGAPPSGNERFVFTTQYDQGLAAYVRSRPSFRFNIFRTSSGSGVKMRNVRFLGEPSLDMFPGFWFLRRDSFQPEISLSMAQGSLLEERLRVKRF